MRLRSSTLYLCTCLLLDLLCASDRCFVYRPVGGNRLIISFMGNPWKVHSAPPWPRFRKDGAQVE